MNESALRWVKKAVNDHTKDGLPGEPPREEGK
jgi:hypothetical protein